MSHTDDFVDNRGCGRSDCSRSGAVVTVELPEKGRRTLCVPHARRAVEEDGATLINEEDKALTEAVGGEA